MPTLVETLVLLSYSEYFKTVLKYFKLGDSKNISKLPKSFQVTPLFDVGKTSQVSIIFYLYTYVYVYCYSLKF